MGLFKTAEERRIERDIKIRQGIRRIEKSIREQGKFQDDFIRNAKLFEHTEQEFTRNALGFLGVILGRHYGDMGVRLRAGFLDQAGELTDVVDVAMRDHDRFDVADFETVRAQAGSERIVTFLRAHAGID